MSKKKGFTLVELLIAIALLGILGIMIANLVRIPIKAHQMSEKEYDVQSELRSTSELVNNSIRNATAAFLLSKNDTHFADDWNYLICEKEDGMSRVVLYRWNGGMHDRQVLAEASANEINYSIEFKTAGEGQLLDYDIVATNIQTGKKDDVTSKVKPLNSFNIMDNSKIDYTLSPPRKSANCLAFRTDKPTVEGGGESGYHHVSVTLVLDASGSMNWNLAGTTEHDANNARIALLKKELHKFFETLKDGDKDGIVDVRIVPFSMNAFDGNQSFARGRKFGKFLNVKSNGIPYFKSVVNGISTASGTNVGDGLRLAYYDLLKYENDKRSVSGGSKKRIKHYLFVLTDGVPTITTTTNTPNPDDDQEKSTIFWQGKGYQERYFVLSEYPKGLIVFQGRGRYVDEKHYSDPNKPGFFGEIKYVEKVAEKFKNYRAKNPHPENVEVMVIGFSASRRDKAYCDRIGKALGAKKNALGAHYEDCSTGADLGTSFKTFTESVLKAANLWYVAGPQ